QVVLLDGSEPNESAFERGVHAGEIGMDLGRHWPRIRRRSRAPIHSGEGDPEGSERGMATTPPVSGSPRTTRVLDPSFVEHLDESSLAEVRRRRDEALAEREFQSYLRRLVQV